MAYSSTSCFRVYDVNLVEQSVLTASTENALYPSSNINDNRRTKVFRTTTNSDNLVLDFQETSSINGIFLLTNKRDGIGVSTVVVEFNNANTWAAPAYSVTMSLNSSGNVFHATFSTVTYRYCRIVMTSTLGYCELANVFIGKELDLTRTINFGWNIKDEELSIKTRNRYGQLFADVIGRQKIMNISFKFLDKVDLELLNVMLDRTGETKPFYIALGNSEMASDYRRFSGAVTLDDIPSATNTSFNKFNLSMVLREIT